MNTIRDAPTGRGKGSDSGNAAYYLPERVCASCGLSTRGALPHVLCARVNGRLVVKA